MKAVILGTISLSVVSALAQNTVVVIPAFENRFGGPHQTVITVRSEDSRRTASPLIPSRGAGGSSSGIVASEGRRVQALDAATMNIPVFPGPAFGTPDATTVTVFQQGFGFSPITNVFGQVIGAAGTIPTLPTRTTGSGPATNAVPAPASPVLSSPEFNSNLGRPPVQPGAAANTQQGAPVGPGLSPTFGAPAGAPVPSQPAPRTPSASGATDATPAPAAPRPTP